MYSIKEAAKYTGLSESTMHRIAYEGHAKKIGRDWFFEKKFLDSKTIEERKKETRGRKRVKK